MFAAKLMLNVCALLVIFQSSGGVVEAYPGEKCSYITCTEENPCCFGMTIWPQCLPLPSQEGDLCASGCPCPDNMECTAVECRILTNATMTQ